MQHHQALSTPAAEHARRRDSIGVHHAMRVLGGAWLVWALAWLPSCGGQGESSTDSSGDTSQARESGPPLVVCTTVMVGDLVREIASDEFEVVTMFGPDVDPHLFRPTRDDVALLTRADLVIYSGFHLEGYLQENFDRLGNANGGTRVMSVCDAIAGRADDAAGVDPLDPHLWMDPLLWSLAAQPIAKELEAIASGESGATARAAQLEKRLRSMDKKVAKLIEGVPEGQRVLVTAHDAFHYFGRRYGVEVHAIQGVSTASEAGLRAMEELVDLIVQRKIPAVFFESTVAERSVRALVEGADARGHRVTIGGTLHSDAPGSAATYEGMIRHNAQVISTALQGGADRDQGGAGREGTTGGAKR